MTTRLWSITLCLAVSFGCGSKPPPPPPAPKEEPPPPPPPKKEEPPPPPKCEAMTESCTAQEGTKARIGESGLVFDPPVGWTYAQESDAAIAAMGESWLAVTIHDSDPKDAKKQLEQREAALALLYKKIEVTPPKAKMAWGAAPAKKLKVGDMTISLWQVDGATHKGKKGPVLVMMAKHGTDKGLVGLAFVPDDDKSNADQAILKSIETIAKAP
jgi:hypothetical protein